MLRLLLTAFSALLLNTILFAQSPLQIGLFGGLSQYQGDLQSSRFQGRFAHAAVGVTASYDIAPRLSLRAGLTFSGLEASDEYNTEEVLRPRNFSFYTRLSEANLVGKYHFFNIDETRWSPYAFAGLALFHFDPYTYDSSGAKVYLQPLGTEGQGLDQYPGRKMYRKTQLAIPFGLGLDYALSERFLLGFELGVRKTFTDYIDDVSGSYADAADLLAGRGQQAVDLAYRRDEVDPAATAYPQKDAMRGNSRWKDMYYFAGLHLQFRLGTGGGKRGIGCPSVTQ